MLLQGLIRPSSRYLTRFPKTVQMERFVHSTPKMLTIGGNLKSALQSVTDIKHAPAPALFYGVSGLIPFTAIPAYMFQCGAYIPELAFTSLAYSAVILSFLGGVRWGSYVTNPEMAKSGWKELGWAVTPSLLGWTSLLVSNLPGSLIAISSFSLLLVQDANTIQYPSWYRSMRIVLSTIVILTLLATLMSRWLLPLESNKKSKETSS